MLEETGTSFNTSHVVIYPKTRSILRSELSTFQYISCCYLSFNFPTATKSATIVSIHLMLLFIRLMKTDIHVQMLVSIHLMLLFILWVNPFRIIVCQFQYISCCYLSDAQVFEDTFAGMFQYISCCYLSNLSVSLLLCFLLVSIHLMLLFIDLNLKEPLHLSSFQYISCCYLSVLHCLYWESLLLVSIHLMLLFIQRF